MKIQCDVCHKAEACVFCVADEAALCHSCHRRIHHPNNNLLTDHHTFSLLQPSSPKHSPLCDICQERKAFMFCQQDRAILCRGCDVGIHKANEHTQKHNRFLLTGVKISATSSSSSSSAAPTNHTQNPTNIKPVVSPYDDDKGGGNGELMMMTSSSISEYLQMLPGFHVEELLDSSSYGFPKIGDDDNDGLPFWGSDDLESNLISTFTSEIITPATTVYGGQIGIKNSMEAANKSSRKWRKDNTSFAVPQISTSPFTFKKSRTLC
ncbi:PREDICTED: B-box zinc finger protein 21-like [Ipomoea nil]|uniref:B-box zinc finger protein 21-like n=1 Tax=Ipomoea nil TaxID=35883 RepID=UPI00090090E0|nr:PREDICTED: B-box zinc finger protein 21-like [Ipomoea nil]